jgi:hypothetical protein
MQAATGGASATAQPAAARAPDARLPVDTSSAETVFADLPSATERDRLGALGAQLKQVPVPDKPVQVAPRERLAPVVPQHIVGFLARGPIVQGPSAAGGEPIAMLSRTYADAARELYVKVTDTARVPALRAAALDQLGAVGNAASGYLHGRLLSGYPATVQYYPKAKNAQVVVLLGNRYLVEVRVVPAQSAQEAILLAQRLPLSGLAPPEPASEPLHTGVARATASDK